MLLRQEEKDAGLRNLLLVQKGACPTTTQDGSRLFPPQIKQINEQTKHNNNNPVRTDGRFLLGLKLCRRRRGISPSEAAARGAQAGERGLLPQRRFVAEGCSEARKPPGRRRREVL